MHYILLVFTLLVVDCSSGTFFAQEVRRYRVLETEFEYQLDHIDWKRVDELFDASHEAQTTGSLYDSLRSNNGFWDESTPVDKTTISKTIAYFRDTFQSIPDYPYVGMLCDSVIQVDERTRVSNWNIYVHERGLATGEQGLVQIVEIDGKIAEPTRRLIKETKLKLPDGTMSIRQLTIDLSKQLPVEITGKVLTKYSAVETARTAFLKENPALHKLLGENEANVTEIVIDGRCGWLVWFSSSDAHVRYEAPFPAWLPKELSQDLWDTWEDGEGSLSVLPVLVWENGQVDLGAEKPCLKWEKEP